MGGRWRALNAKEVDAIENGYQHYLKELQINKEADYRVTLEQKLMVKRSILIVVLFFAFLYLASDFFNFLFLTIFLFPGGLFKYGDAETAPQIHATYVPNRTLATVSHLGTSGSNACKDQSSSDRQSVVGMCLPDHTGTGPATEKRHAKHRY